LLSDGTQIDYVDTGNGSGFKVWKEHFGNRILFATGLWSSQSDWQKQLNRRGIGSGTDDFVNYSEIGGRVCPPNIFLDYSHMVETNQCLYYDLGNSRQQTLDEAFSGGVEGEDWLRFWDSTTSGQGADSSYYEGNIKTCADKGMRLPVIYETSSSLKNYSLPTGDGIAPVWAGDTGTGVPSAVSPVGSSNADVSWTASATTFCTSSSSCRRYYWAWNSTYSNSGYFYFYNLTVRCVLPPAAESTVTSTTTTTRWRFH
jgi:hypothetical protein